MHLNSVIFATSSYFLYCWQFWAWHKIFNK